MAGFCAQIVSNTEKKISFVFLLCRFSKYIIFSVSFAETLSDFFNFKVLKESIYVLILFILTPYKSPYISHI